MERTCSADRECTERARSVHGYQLIVGVGGRVKSGHSSRSRRSTLNNLSTDGFIGLASGSAGTENIDILKYNSNIICACHK